MLLLGAQQIRQVGCPRTASSDRLGGPTINREPVGHRLVALLIPAVVAEEDDIVLYWSMAAGFWITKMPYMGDLDFYYMNDWPARKRRRYNDFYRECVKRQLYLNGADKVHLSKNPTFSGKIESLIETFPDARFDAVTVVRPRSRAFSACACTSTPGMNFPISAQEE